MDEQAIALLVQELRRHCVALEMREHEPARHARHLAALWSLPLHLTGRATLFYADGRAILALVPADRKVSAPRFRDVLDAKDLRVLRGDRGVGKLGWRDMAGNPGALPAVPGMFFAHCYVDARVCQEAQLAVALGEGQSMALDPRAYVEATGAHIASFTGTTRLLPEGGMTDDGAGAR